MQKLILIIGIWRSGTSLLRDIVKLHPEVDGPSFEPHYIRQSMQKYSWDKFKHPQEVLQFIKNHKKFNNDEFDISTLSNINQPIQTKDFWFKFFQTFKTDKKFIVIKDPRSLLHLNHSMDVLNIDKIILIKRDPRAIFASQKKLWPTKNVYHTSFFWNNMLNIEEKYKGESIFKSLFYADLMYQPDQEIKKVFDFISTDYKLDKLKDQLPVLNANRMNNWKDKLNSSEIQQVEYLCNWDDYYDKRYSEKLSISSILKLYKETLLKPDLLLDRKPVPLLALPKHYWYNFISNRF